MKFTVFGVTTFEVEPDKWKISRCKGITRPAEMELTLPRSVPVNDRVKIEAEEDGKIWFRGYVFSQKIESKTKKTVKCYGVEDLLFRRICPRYGMTRSFANYGSAWADTWKPVYRLLESENPSIDQFGPRLGLLYMANSAIPEGYLQHYDDDNWTFIAYGFGTNFSAGAVSIFGKALTSKTSLADCLSTANSYYRDEQDLYIHPNATNFPDAIHGIVCIENAFDTTIRLGEYSDDLNSENVHIAGLSCTGETYGDLIQAIADWHGMDIAIRYDPDGYTYLEMIEDPGRHIDGSVELREEDLADVSSESPDEFTPQVLYGLGYGGQEGRQRCTIVDAEAAGFWLHDTYENENVFEQMGYDLATIGSPPMGLLNHLTAEEWNRRWGLEDIYELELVKPLQIDPYDYINLKLDYEPARILPVEQIDYSDGKMTIALGNRDSDILDQYNNRGSDQCYAKDLIRDGDPIWSTSGDVNVTPGSFLSSAGAITSWGTPGRVSIACSSSYADGATRVILEVSTDEDIYWNWGTLIKITCDDVANDDTIFRFYKTLDNSGEIDITDICPPGDTKTFKFYLVYTGPQIFVPNPVVVHYSVKYIYADDVDAWRASVESGYTTKLIYDAGIGARCPNYSPYLATAYQELDGQLGRPSALNAAGLTKADGILVIDMMCDYPSRLKSGGEIEICSGGASNNHEWHIAVPYTQITNSWQTFELPLSAAVTVGGELDVTKINYFQWWNKGTAQFTISWRRAYLKYPTP